jgi:hypothetical protein
MARSSSELAGVLFLCLTSGCFQPANEFPDGGSPTDAGPVERVCGRGGDGNDSITIFSPSSPETVGCTRFLGALIISVSNEGDLRPLQSLREAEKVYISLLQVRSLAGLEALTTVAEMKIFETYMLEDIRALSALSVVGKLSLTLNPKLTSLDGLSGIRELDELTIRDNESLASLAGLSNLTHIRGDLTLYANTSLKPGEVSAFLNRVTVDGRTILQ